MCRRAIGGYARDGLPVDLERGGAVVLPVSAYPAVVQPMLRLLPFGALGELLRGWAGGTASGWPVLVLAAWAALCLLLARKAFRWMS